MCLYLCWSGYWNAMVGCGHSATEVCWTISLERSNRCKPWWRWSHNSVVLVHRWLPKRRLEWLETNFCKVIELMRLWLRSRSTVQLCMQLTRALRLWRARTTRVSQRTATRMTRMGCQRWGIVRMDNYCRTKPETGRIGCPYLMPVIVTPWTIDSWCDRFGRSFRFCNCQLEDNQIRPIFVKFPTDCTFYCSVSPVVMRSLNIVP